MHTRTHNNLYNLYNTHTHTHIHAYMHIYVVYAMQRAHLCACSRARYVYIYVQARARSRAPLYTLRASRRGGYDARVAGASWTRITANAEWKARYGHASVIDAAGSIYLLGGVGGNKLYFSATWRSANQGEAPQMLCDTAAPTHASPAVRARVLCGCCVRVGCS
jgi:hypothetical protein